MKRKITYTDRNGYLYPDLIIQGQETFDIGRFGQKHRAYLKMTRKGMYFRLLVSGKLAPYLAEIDSDAQSMFETIVNQSKESNGITEQLKEENPMEWVRQMNAIVNMAEEFVLAEIVYK